MSDLKVRLLLEAEAAAARRALQETQTELRQTGEAARQASAQGVAGAVALERANLAVAGSAGTVAAQFNDIGQMWMMGQSPFVTAIQQGTQLNQILGTQGMAGAAATARAALASMLNPFNLAVIAALTVGGTFVQWLMDTGEAAKSVEDRMKDLAEATKSYAEAAKAAEQPIEALRVKYGELADEVKRALDAQRDEAAFRAAQAVGDLLGADALGIGNFLEQIDRLDQAEARLAQLRADLAAAQAAPAPDVGQVNDLQTQILAQTAAVDQQRLAVDDLQLAYSLTTDQVRQLSAATQAYAQANGPAEVAVAADRLAAALIDVYGSAAAANAATDGLVTALYAAVRAGADQQRTAAQTSDILAGTVGVAGDLASALLDAAGAAEQVAGADIAGRISAALGPAAALAARLWDAASAAAAAAAQQVEARNNYGRLQNTFGSGPDAARAETWHLNHRVAPGTPGTGAAGPASPSSGGGAGGGGVDRNSLAGLRAAAAEALQALDVAVAAIGVKVEAGLVSASDAAEGVSQAKERAADDLAELIAKLQAMGPAGEAAAAQLKASLDGLVPAANRLSDTLEEGFKGPFADFVAGAATGKEAFADFAQFIQRKLAELAANQVWDGLFAPLLGGIGGGGGGLGGGLGGIVSLLFGGDLFGGLFATGGAPLSAMANRVVGTPTPFRMGDGRTGILGEQDDEAIMPLRGQGALALLPGGGEVRLPLARGAGGDLGIVLPPDLIAAAEPFARGGAPRFAIPPAPDMGRRGGATPAGPAAAAGQAPSLRERIKVQVTHNGAPVQAEAEVRQDGEDISIDILLEQVEGRLARNVGMGRGPLVTALQRTMGLRRQGQ